MVVAFRLLNSTFIFILILILALALALTLALSLDRRLGTPLTSSHRFLLDRLNIFLGIIFIFIVQVLVLVLKGSLLLANQLPLIEVVKHGVVVGSLEIRCHCVEILGLGFGAEYLAEETFLLFGLGLLEFYGREFFLGELITLPLHDQPQLLILDHLVLPKPEHDPEHLLRALPLPLPLDPTLHPGTALQNFTIFLPMHKTYRLQRLLPEPGNCLRLVLVNAEGLCELMLAVELFLEMLAGCYRCNLVR